MPNVPQMPEAPEAPHHRHEDGRAVDHRRVDHLALARRGRPRRARTRRRTPCSMPPPPKSPTRLIGGVGLRAGPAEVRERAGERDVVDVVAGGLRVRAVLTPARHPAVDELRVAGEARVGPDPESLGDAGPEALDERVGLLDERSTVSTPSGCFRSTPIDRRPAVEDLEVGRGRSRCTDLRRGRRARPRRPCRRASSRRTGPARSRRSRRPSLPTTVPTRRSSGQLGAPHPDARTASGDDRAGTARTPDRHTSEREREAGSRPRIDTSLPVPEHVTNAVAQVVTAEADVGDERIGQSGRAPRIPTRRARSR